MSLIELKKVSKSFEQKGGQIQALKEISLSIEESDIYGIIGMSGAGKSTLVRCLNYLERPTSGSVVIDGKDLSTLSGKELRQERESISMIFQHFNLLMQKNVLDNVCFPLRLKKIKKKEAQEKALQLLETVGLKEKAKAYPSQLSGGQKQRVAIARALASNPKILLCDEATSALDPQTTEAILKLLKQIHKEYGITIVIITHQMSVIQEICNKVAIIEGGELVEEGSADGTEQGTHLANAGGIHYEPFGIYPGSKSSLDEIAEGDVIAIPNDTTNEARALLLLADNGLLKLKEGAGLTATINDIEENPKGIEFKELEAAQIPRVREEVAFVVLNGNYALEAGLSVAKDSIAFEKSDSEAAKTYVNIIAVKEGRENDEAIQALVKVLQSDEIKNYINDTYDGAVVPFE